MVKEVWTSCKSIAVWNGIGKSWCSTESTPPPNALNGAASSCDSSTLTNFCPFQHYQNDRLSTIQKSSHRNSKSLDFSTVGPFIRRHYCSCRCRILPGKLNYFLVELAISVPMLTAIMGWGCHCHPMLSNKRAVCNVETKEGGLSHLAIPHSHNLRVLKSRLLRTHAVQRQRRNTELDLSHYLNIGGH